MEYDHNKYKVLNWKNLTNLHAIINPGLAFNELILGQRIAKTMLIDQTSDKPLMERTYVPCPHCGTLHDGRIWSQENNLVFKNWFGLYCVNCEKIIPCLRNATSLLILALTFPLWGWFKDDLKARWLAKQPERYQDISITETTHANVPWLKMGLAFGGFLFVMLTVIQLIAGEAITLYWLGTNFVVSLSGGFIFSGVMRFWMGLQGDASSRTATGGEQ